MDKYEGKDNSGRPKSEFLKKLTEMSRDELSKQTEHYIWLSAYASNNPRSDYHWMCDATYDEWKRRNDIDGYKAAYEKVSRSL